MYSLRHARTWARLLAVGALAAAAFVPVGGAAVRADNDGQRPERPFGDVKVVAPVGPPYFPEGVAVKGDKVYIAGPATFTTPDQPAYVRAYNLKTGALVREYLIQGEASGPPRANSCIAFDAQGRLYVINVQLGIVRIDLGSGHQEIYASALPALTPPPGQNPFPLPNDLAFDDDGFLYETDSFQATIWRIRPGGGAPEIWFQDPRLATAFGPNGVRVSPDGDRLFFDITADTIGATGFTGGGVYSLPLVNHPRAADLKLFHAYNGEGPDGMAFGACGDLYVMLASPGASGISILKPNGAEKARLGDTAFLTPFDSPANGAFDGRGDLIVTNHASLVPPASNASILNVFVDDEGLPLNRPNLP